MRAPPLIGKRSRRCVLLVGRGSVRLVGCLFITSTSTDPTRASSAPRLIDASVEPDDETPMPSPDGAAVGASAGRRREPSRPASSLVRRSQRSTRRPMTSRPRQPPPRTSLVSSSVLSLGIGPELLSAVYAKRAALDHLIDRSRRGGTMRHLPEIDIRIRRRGGRRRRSWWCVRSPRRRPFAEMRPLALRR